MVLSTLSCFAATLLVVSSLAISSVALPTTGVYGLEKRAISQSLIDDFEWYVKYASGAYQLFCPVPNGKVLVTQVRSLDLVLLITWEITHDIEPPSSASRPQTHRDISLEMIRGKKSSSPSAAVFNSRTSLQVRSFLTIGVCTDPIMNYFTDIEFLLADYTSPGVPGSLVGGVQVHYGFLTAYNSVAATVISAVQAQLVSYPSYTIISLGHSLGAALASLGGISIAENFPDVPLRVYTFGQPRTGNPSYANLAESVIGVENIFRSELCIHPYNSIEG